MILVTGATGSVGPRVVEGFCRKGYRVRTLSLENALPGVLPMGVEANVGDITDASVVQAVTQGVTIVIHLAALLHIVNPSAAVRERYERVNVGGTGALTAAASQAGVRRVVFFSTIAVYGDSRGRMLDEDAPACPNNAYAKSKLTAEAIVLGTRGSDGQPIGTVLRLGAVYGSGIKGNYRRLLDLLVRRRFVAVGNGRNRRTLVYDRDVAQAAALAAEHPAAAGRVYNVTDGQVHTMNEIVETICNALGRTPPRIRLPVGAVRLAAGVLEDAAGVFGRESPIDRAAIDKYTEDIAVEGRRIQAELGFVPKYDLTSGWREAILAMRQAGQL